MHYLLIYDLADDYLERRHAFRTDHLALARKAQERGEIVLAGALSDPADKAVLLFEADSPEPRRTLRHLRPLRRERTRQELDGAGVDDGDRQDR